MDDELLTSIETRLMNEIAIIDARIRDLTIEKGALQKQISKARADRTGVQNVTRKNGVNRVLAENSVIEMLKTRKSCSTRQLYHNALSTNFDLKENTFRSYLYRMKTRDLIETAGRAGTWRISESKTDRLS